jgi:hypothetical protein
VYGVAAVQALTKNTEVNHEPVESRRNKTSADESLDVEEGAKPEEYKSHKIDSSKGRL